jgi:hypothetical protein
MILKETGGQLQKGDGLRIYGMGLICIDCPRCGRTREAHVTTQTATVC